MIEFKDIEAFKEYIAQKRNIPIKKEKHFYYSDILRLVFGIDVKNIKNDYKFDKNEFLKLKEMLKGTFHERFLEDAIET